MNEMKNNFLKSVQQSNNILISAHINPDGDSIGSSFGLALVLKHLGKNVKIIKNDDYPKYLDFLYREDLYLNSDMDEIDLFIALDSASIDRLGDSIKYFNKAKNTVCIDHHITNTGYAEMNLVIQSSSTCEILAYMLIENNIYIPEDAATYFYLGILTDTGRFNYQTSNSQTLRVAADLLDINADKNLIHDNLYEKMDASTIIFQSDMLKKATHIGDKVILVDIKKTDIEKYGYTFDDVEGIVSLLRTIDGIEVACIVKEYEDDEQKLSFRSHNIIDVSEIAKEFGGGGHIRASGATVKGTNDEVFKLVQKRLEKLYEDGNLNSK